MSIKPVTAPAPFQWIWKSPCLPKHKFFFWLLIQDILNTRDLLDRKHFYVESKSCVLCDGDIREDMIHLFFRCPFSSAFWDKLGHEWLADLGLMDMLIQEHNNSTNAFF